MSSSISSHSRVRSETHLHPIHPSHPPSTQTHKPVTDRHDHETMRSAAAPILLIALIISLLAQSSSSFSFQATRQHRSRNLAVVMMSATEQNENDQQQLRHPHCDLPGDPSLFLTTNVNLGDNKSAILKELSSLVAAVTKKPESYVGEWRSENINRSSYVAQQLRSSHRQSI